MLYFFFLIESYQILNANNLIVTIYYDISYNFTKNKLQVIMCIFQIYYYSVILLTKNMNHTIKSIIIVAAIASMLVVGINMIPLAQNTYASSHRHQDNIANQGDDTYRSPGSQSSNVGIQESGKGNSATAFSDQSSNTTKPTNITTTEPTS